MKAKSLILILIALGCGSVAAVGATQVLENRKTGDKKQTEKIGFFTSRKNRTQIFDYVGSLMKDNVERLAFGIRHAKTIKEIAGCIVGRNGRPDHAKRGHNDSLITLAIGLFIFKAAREQIKNNIDAYGRKKKASGDGWGDRGAVQKETRPMFGGRGMDSRNQRQRRMR